MITAGFWCELVERRCFAGAVRTQSRRCMLCMQAVALLLTPEAGDSASLGIGEVQNLVKACNTLLPFKVFCMSAAALLVPMSAASS